MQPYVTISVTEDEARALGYDVDSFEVINEGIASFYLKDGKSIMNDFSCSPTEWESIKRHGDAFIAGQTWEES